MPKLFRFVLLIVIMLFAVWFSFRKEKYEAEKDTLDKLNLELSGVVIKVRTFNGYNGTGAIQIKILSSNIVSYDPRSYSKFYYCIIKNGVAEIYDGHANSISVGDTISINTNSKTIKWKNKNGDLEEGTIWVNSSESLYKNLSENY